MKSRIPLFFPSKGGEKKEKKNKGRKKKGKERQSIDGKAIH
jgi:hypothetical protein